MHCSYRSSTIRQALARLFRSVGSPVATVATAEEFLRSDRPGTTACPAHGDKDARVWASPAGAVAFLGKPFDTPCRAWSRPLFEIPSKRRS